MNRISHSLLSTACLLLVFGHDVAHAVRVQRLSLDDLREQAASVVVATVESTATRLGADVKMVWTDYTVRIDEVLAGHDPGQARTVSVAGGERLGLHVGILGVPRFRIGTQYVLFLLPADRPWATPTVGWNQGILEVRNDTDATSAQLVSYDGEPLQLTAAGLRRGPTASRPIQGTPVLGDNAERAPREVEALILDADGNVIVQTGPEVVAIEAPAEAPPFATLDDLRRFVRHQLDEDPGGAR